MAEKYIRYFYNTETGKYGDYVGILISPAMVPAGLLGTLSTLKSFMIADQ